MLTSGLPTSAWVYVKAICACVSMRCSNNVHTMVLFFANARNSKRYMYVSLYNNRVSILLQADLSTRISMVSLDSEPKTFFFVSSINWYIKARCDIYMRAWLFVVFGGCRVMIYK